MKPLARSIARAAALAAFCISAIAQAQSMKIGVLDFKAVTDRSTYIQGLLRNAETPVAGKKKAVEDKTAEYSRQRAALDQRRSVISAEQAAAEDKKLDAIKEEIQDLQYDINKQYAKLDGEIMQPAVDQVMAIVKAIAKEEGFDLVLPSEMTLYHTDAIDLTQRVVQRLDKEGPALTPTGGSKPALPKPVATPAAKPTKP